jgi:DNA-binding response OmpR family regulator
MSQQHPFILYVGSLAQGRQFLDVALARGSWAYIAEDAAEALGAFIAYTPDAVVLDPTREAEKAAEVYHHLRSVEARPLFVLTQDRDWDVSITEADDVYVIRPDARPDELFEFVTASLEPVELPPAFVY